MSKLTNIQVALKAPKSQFNSFGRYNYRNCEDIMEALKPLLDKEGLTLIMSDSIVPVMNRIYVQATAVLFDGKEVVATVSALAREPEDRKGMDASQITGASSSYARKYCLSGMFLIDDNKDPDATNDHGKEEKKVIGGYSELKEKKPTTPATPSKASSGPTGIDKVFTVLGVTSNTSTHRFFIKVENFGPIITDKEAFAQIAKDNIGKKCTMKYTVDPDMFNILLNITPYGAV